VVNLFKILESKYNKQLLGRNREPNILIGKHLRVVCFYIIFMFAYMEANSLGSLMLCHQH
jgi:hypothetical protein